MNRTEVFDIAAYCQAAGITQAVISPGSRSALITLSFARAPEVTCIVAPDERSAAFIALGMAQASGVSVALVCTSGSAALNYFPAVAEAYFNQVPLVVFTADRPPEWIDQYDGQTIFQENVYGKHVKASLNLPVDTTSPESSQSFSHMLRTGLTLSMQSPQGPVHFNVPIREPFYSKELAGFTYSAIDAIADDSPEVVDIGTDSGTFYSSWQNSKRILIIPGQMEANSEVSDVLLKISASNAVVICQDIISNIQSANGVNHHDLFLGDLPDELENKLAPDLLVTFGRSIISKQLKGFIRNHKPVNHFHFENTAKVHDPFQSVTQVFHMDPLNLLSGLPNNEQQSSYSKDWKQVDDLTNSLLNTSIIEFSELQATQLILSRLETGDNLHLANSMPVRYANYINNLSGVAVWSNRGVSGIDGCTSTAIGHALANPEENHFLLTGDIAFLYDRNALWQKILPQNLKIIVYNNGGGGIFRLINGPSDLPELQEYFEFSHQKSMHAVAEEIGIGYGVADTKQRLTMEWEKLSQSDQIRILEIKVDPEKTGENYQAFKVILKENLAEL